MDGELNDESVMTFGEHIGKELQDVPAEYLIWYKENVTNPKKELIDYIEDNWSVLLKEVKY